MTEDSIGSPADLSRDDSSDLGGSDSLRRRQILMFWLYGQLGEPSKKKTLQKLGIWTNRRTTPPPPHKLGHQIKKKNLMFILHFRQSLSIFFFFISYHFFGRDNEGGVQYPHELIRYCLLMYDNYLMQCVFHQSYKANLILDNFNKNLGFGQTPPTPVGPNSQLWPKIKFEGSPNICMTKSKNLTTNQYVNC